MRGNTAEATIDRIVSSILAILAGVPVRNIPTVARWRVIGTSGRGWEDIAGAGDHHSVCLVRPVYT